MATIKYGGASNRVLAYLREHSNLIIPQVEIGKALKYPDYTVSNSIGTLIRNGHPVTRPHRGTVIYSTAPPPIAEVPKSQHVMYELVGISKGVIIVRDEDDELFRLEPLWSE